MSYGNEIAAAMEGREFADPDELAADIAPTLSPDSVVEMLADYIRTVQRNLTRKRERAVFEAMASGPEVRAAFDEAQVRMANLHQSFAPLFRSIFVVDGQRIEWGRATIEQHVARIRVLEKLSAGLQDTIERHRVAIAAIRTAGVTCLEEVGAAVKPVTRRALAKASA